MSALRFFDKFQKLLDVTWGSIADGQTLKRSGTNIIGYTPGGGSGDVVGPASAVSGNVASYSGTTGKLIADSGKLAADVVTGPASATTGRIATYNGTTGKIIQDGAKLATDLVVGAASSVDSEVALFSGTGGKTLKRATGTGLVNVTSGVYQTPIDPVVLTPTGSVMDFAGSTAPTGWVLCDGASLLRAGTYAALFAVIGVVYGSVDGTHFNVPDLRGRMVAGKDNMGGIAANRLTSASSAGINGLTLGAAGGVQEVTLTVAELASHTHDINNPFGSPGGLAAGSNYGIAGTTNPAGGDQPHSNVPPAMVLNKIIKY